MTNDELLAKMLDGTITPAEKSLLTSEALKNATLAQAIEQLQRVEALLAQSPHSYSAATDEFLKSIEDEIAEKVRDNRRKPVPILPPYIDTKWNWNILLYSVSAIITVGAAGYFGYTALTTPTKTLQSTPDAQVSAPAINMPQPVSTSDSPVMRPTTAPAQPTSGKVVSTRPDVHSVPVQQQNLAHQQNVQQPQSQLQSSNSGTSNPVAAAPLPLSSAPVTTTKTTDTPANNGANEVEGKTASEGTIKLQQKRMALLAQLAEKRSGGDKFGEMALNKQIGMLYSSDGKHDEALKHFETALSHSRSVNARNEEGLILGEIGLLESKFGNKEIAITKIQQAIDILSKAGMNHDKWTRELLKLTK